MILLRANNASTWTGPTGNNTFLLPGRLPALIDAGVGEQAHIASLAEALGGAALARVLITHGHSDHVKGIPALMERWPHLRALRMKDDFDDGDLVPAGDIDLRVVHTPGHAPDHVCFLDEGSGDMFTGDLIRVGGTIVIPATKGGNLRHYLDSLQRVRAMRPKRLLPAHGPAIDDVGASIDKYLRHRAMRERQVVQALRAGLNTPEALSTRVYGEVHPAIAAAAVESILAHLVKLQEEGKAIRGDAGTWSLV